MTHVLRRPLVALGLLIAFIGFTAIAPTQAAAQTSLDVSGSLVGGGSFSGVIVDPEFVAFHESLELRGHLEGVVTVDGVETEISLDFAQFAYVSERTNCNTLYYGVAPIALEVIGDEVQLDEIAMERPPSGLLGGLLGGGDSLFCAMDDLLGNGSDTEELADLLNELLDDLGY